MNVQIEQNEGRRRAATAQEAGDAGDDTSPTRRRTAEQQLKTETMGGARGFILSHLAGKTKASHTEMMELYN